ncbi:hypothetical protein SNEBB_006870 [Seison nebaliae]|nr:hypothetical protein SNEBB_006870 [Seison nebaliae]
MQHDNGSGNGHNYEQRNNDVSNKTNYELKSNEQKSNSPIRRYRNSQIYGHKEQYNQTNVNLSQTVTNDDYRYKKRDNDDIMVTQHDPPLPRRKGHCVKEIDKIRRHREDRRNRQKQIQDYDTPQNRDFVGMINTYRQSMQFTPITDNEHMVQQRIVVCIRKRPMNRREVNVRKEIDVISVPSRDIIVIHQPKLKVDMTKFLDNQRFRFTYTFDDDCDNSLVYQYTARPLVEHMFEGNMSMCFAYGQTGSGKTHTMGGDTKAKTIHNGIYAMTSNDIFDLLENKYCNKFFINVSFFEIYCGKVFDLLNRKERLRVLEDSKNIVRVVDLRECHVIDVNEVLHWISYGMDLRTSGQTSANDNSSRSHAIFQFILRCQTSGKLHGKISLIDLAGSERGKDTQSSDRVTRNEGAEINRSLLALKECIRALGREDNHIPFRGSTLTKVLRDSFIQTQSKVCMIATISPGNSDVEHTLNTLRYADRVKELDTEQEMVDTNDVPTITSTSPSITSKDVVRRIRSNINNSIQNMNKNKNRNHWRHNECEDVVEDEENNDGINRKLIELNELEESIYLQHHNLLQEEEKTVTTSRQLLHMTNADVFDLEEYVKSFENHIQNSMHRMNLLQGIYQNLQTLKSNLQQDDSIIKNRHSSHCIDLARNRNNRL